VHFWLPFPSDVPSETILHASLQDWVGYRLLNTFWHIHFIRLLYGSKNFVHALPKSEAHPDMNTAVPKIIKRNKNRMVAFFIGIPNQVGSGS